MPIGVPWRVFSAGQGFGGWVVESGTVEIVSAWQDADGDQSVDLSGLGRGAIYQDVPTTPGRLYLLRFALAGNPQGAPAVKALEVTFGAASLGQFTFDTTGHTTADMGWEYHSFVVTASAAITRLRFISLTDSVHGAMVDDVSLTPLGDYLPVAGTLTFAPGETSKTVTVPVIGDRLDETDETFRLLLSNPAGVVPPPAQLTGTILDDDTIPPDRFEPNDTRQTAADLGTIASRAVSGLTIHAPGNDDYFDFHAGRSGVAVVTVSFIPGALGLNFDVLDGSGAVIGSSTGPGGFVRPAVDRNHTLAGVRFPSVAGEVYYVRVYGEQSAADADYTLSVTNSSGDRFEPNNAPDLATDLGVLGQRSETGLRIADRLDVDFFHFTAAASGPLAAWLEPRGVQDQALLELFDAAGTRLASVPGSKQQQTVSGEGSPTVLTFQVALGQVYFLRVSHRSPGSVGLMGDGGGLDYDLRISAPGDGPAALPRLSVADIFAPESNSVSGPKPFIFTVLLSEPASTDVTIRYSTADGTAVAGEGGDYQAASGTLVIPAGATAAPITVMVNADTRLEPNEQFFLNLSGAQGAVLLDGHTVATITNDDVGPPQVAAVYLGGTRWGRSFLNGLQTGGLGSFRFGYAVPAGARQLDPLPWAGINQVSIQFVGGEATSDIVADAGDLKVWGAGGRQYAVAGFAWDFSTRTGTWTLAEPVGADTLRLDLDGDGPDGVRNSRGLLDGEWPGGTGGAFPSGDGGTFSFRVNVLPGDANGDGRVTSADLGEIKLRAGRGVADRLPPWSEPAPLQGTRPLSRAALYTLFHDTSADGLINAFDQAAARRFLHRALSADNASIAQDLFGAAPIFG